MRRFGGAWLIYSEYYVRLIISVWIEFWTGLKAVHVFEERQSCNFVTQQSRVDWAEISLNWNNEASASWEKNKLVCTLYVQFKQFYIPDESRVLGEV